MQLDEILLRLNESLSRVAYHYTNINAAKQILTSGVFELSSGLGSVEQHYMPPGQYYFLSTTRTRVGGYHDIIGSSAVMFVLDGNWFNQHYRSRSVDYWLNRNPGELHHRAHEAEDRVFSPEPTIPIDGVTAIHIYVSPDADDQINAWARQCLIAAKQRDIPTYLYRDKKSWRLLDTRHTTSGALPGQDTARGYVSRYRPRGYLMPWIELLKAKSKNHLSKEADSLRYSLQYSYDSSQAAIGLDNGLSNARKPNSGADRKHANTIIQYMRKNGLTTVPEFVNALADKWAAIK
jgi:hypothetical protein